MDFKVFLSKMRSQVGFHLKDNNSREIINTDDDEVEEDVMYEDFVLLSGESQDEAQASTGGLPSYPAVMRESYHRNSPLQTYSLPNRTAENTVKYPKPNHTAEASLHQMSAIDDVPFQFHSSLCSQQSIQKLFQDVDLRTNVFNWEKYSHDFTQENSCLRDLNSNELSSLKK